MNGRSTKFVFLGVALLASLAGCRHQPPPPPPVAVAAPPITPASITVITPLPSVPAETKPVVKQAEPEKAPVEPVPVPVHHKRRVRRHATEPAQNQEAGAVKPSTPAAAAPTATASTAGTTPATTPAMPPATLSAPPETRAPSVPIGGTASSASSTSASEAATTLGELSAGSTLSGTERTRILSEIQLQETRLARIGTPGTSDGRTVQMQVRSFLAKARQAVSENDLDGARTLNTKAMVLLDELQSE